MIKPAFITFTLLFAPMAVAEQAEYGHIELTGLARLSWPLNPPGLSYAMVCNVNGPDGFLSIRQGPGTQYGINRNLKRLAIVTVDTAQRQGHWIRVTDAYRNHTVDGRDLPGGYRLLPVQGWAHDGYLSDYLD
ncbi:MAG: hypothetical protein ACK5LJ_00715 [Paracoccus sp. (in: a-proteobacteria)]